MNVEWRVRYEVGIQAAEAAAKLALSYFETGLTVERKGDDSPVTLADKAAEEMLRQTLTRHFPDDGFLGEEYGDTPSISGYRWILDPIDGTRSFIKNIPLWATLVGLEYKGEQIAGVIAVPTLGHTYHALRGGGAFRNQRRIRVSDTPTLEQSLLAYSSMSWFRKAGKQETFLNLIAKTNRSRGYGDFYGFVLVAQGSCDVMVEHGVNAWDIAAIRVLIEEAGGRFTDWDGTPTIHRPDIVASNGLVHDATLALLQGKQFASGI